MADLFGIGYEIWGFFALIFFAVFYTVNKSRVKSLSVNTLWMLASRAAYLFPSKQDRNGIYVDVKVARGKKAVSLLQEGLPLEVREIPKNGKAYVIGGTENGKKAGKNGPTVDKADIGKVFYDVHLGGLKHMRLFATIEKTGTTIDFIKDQENNGHSNPHGAIVNQEIGATGAIYDKIEQAARDTWRAVILPLGAGAGLGISVGILLVKVLHI